MDLTGKTALVTGGSSGLGAGMGHALTRAGARVAFSARSPDALDEQVGEATAAGGDAMAIPADLAENGEAERLFAAAVDGLGGVDVLVHAAGNLVRRPALEFDIDEWELTLRLHLRRAFELARATAEALIARERPGSIILIGSLNSHRAGVPDTVAYAAAKSGLLGLMRVLAVEWGPHAIRVNTIAPGFFPTRLTSNVADTPQRQAMHARIPLGRVGDPSDLAGAVVFLASDASAYITGEVLTVDGGWCVA